MALINAKKREIEAKLVYFGTAMGGKTTNLLALHKLTEPDQKQKLVSLNTAGDRTLFFDLLPFDLGKIFDYRLKLKLYTIPGQPEYSETRRVVLAGADGIIFVADSAPERQAENIRSVGFLKLNLKQNQLDPDALPLVFQYNKRDLPGALPSSVLEGDLNWRRAPYFLGTAVHGEGVLETFEEALVQTAAAVLERYGGRGRATTSQEELRGAIHDKLRPLHERRARWEKGTSVAPGTSTGHVVVHRQAEAAEATARPKLLDTTDLLQSALESEMRLLSDVLTRESTPPEPSGLAPDKLAAALHGAAQSTQIEAAATSFLDYACAEAGLGAGSVLLMTGGEGKLWEAARKGIPLDMLNEPAAGAPPPARRLALAAQPVYAPDLVTVTMGTRIVRPEILVPAAAVPLLALGKRLGLLTLYARSDAPPLAPEKRALVEAVAAVLALVLAVRGLERKLGEAHAASEPQRAYPVRVPVGAGR